ncbi:N-acetylneuraminate synthase family protein [uncultured Shewanella sp.]|uniref:N-acetylneuraminate synthase family protein n=1 Tax=uncultured Shewanella sp. TaxID=173975 RepID=UPI00260D1574|nr:N-acetylneuraminate synthase family protein [uncultured Shewanella sp.]
MIELEIAGRKIGNEHPTFVIAEIGINHGGSLVVAKEMVDSAKRAGAEVIKHQTHILDDEMSGSAKKIIPGNTTKSIYQVMDECSLTLEEEIELKHYVEAHNMLYISTPFSRAAADFLMEQNVPAFKIGSGECNNFPLIEHIAGFGKPIILSTGMNDIKTVDKAVEIMEKANIGYGLLHCTNLYPTPPELIRLGAISQMRAHYSNAVIGLSDHSLDNYACFGAVAVGANIIERHYTDHKQRLGPDIVCSMDEKELKELIHGCEVIRRARFGEKNLLEEEQVTRDFAYASVVAIDDIKAGDILTKDNIWVKRPGTGELSAADFEGLLGKKSTRNIAHDEMLKQTDYE